MPHTPHTLHTLAALAALALILATAWTVATCYRDTLAVRAQAQAVPIPADPVAIPPHQSQAYPDPHNTAQDRPRD